MQYDQFLSCIQSGIQTLMGPDARVSLRRVLKNNGHYLDGLTILPPGKNISPAIYLNPYYQDFLDGMAVDDILQTILELYERFSPGSAICLEELQNFEKVRSRVAYRLCHFESNLPLLEQIPYIPKLDLALVFFIVTDRSPDEEMTVTITRDHLKTWDISEQLLYETAARNTPLLYPCHCIPLEQMIAKLTFPETGFYLPETPPEHVSSLSVHILTNYRQINGAACIFYDHVLDDFSRQAGGDFFILPSSIHETILLPCRENTGVEELKNMVKEINETEITPWEKLSDHIYYYHAKKQQISIY